MTILRCKVSEKTNNGVLGFEGTMYIDGLRPTKIARKSDGLTVYSKRSSVMQAARGIAARMNEEVEFVGSVTTTKTKTTKCSKVATPSSKVTSRVSV